MEFQDEKATAPVQLLSFDIANDEGQFILMWIAMGFTFVFYALLTAFGLHNFFKYIVKQQYQLKLLYALAIGASSIRLGTYATMIVQHARNQEVHTMLFQQIDLGVSSLLVAVGLCVCLIMLKLYTYLNCWSIYVNQSTGDLYNRSNDALNEVRKAQEAQATTTRRFEISKVIMLTSMGLIQVFTAT